MMAVIVPMSMRMGEQCMCMLMCMTFQQEQDDDSDKQHASDEVLYLYAFSKHHGRQEYPEKGRCGKKHLPTRSSKSVRRLNIQGNTGTIGPHTNDNCSRHHGPRRRDRLQRKPERRVDTAGHQTFPERALAWC
jgi:hypothetical protein